MKGLSLRDFAHAQTAVALSLYIGPYTSLALVDNFIYLDCTAIKVAK